MRLPFNIICIDIETTDSAPEPGSVIQIGAVVTNDEFEEVDSFETFIKPLDAYRNPKAMAVNRIPEDTLKFAPTLQDALEMFEAFALREKTAKNEKVILASWGDYFDVPFLKSQYDKIGRPWPFGYKSFDLKTIAIWELGKRNIPLLGGVQKALQFLGLEFEGVQHDALADVKNTIRILKKLLQQERPKTGWDV